ncbi:MAG: DUF1343 domain-containing protein [Deltaproteobacteria bacterium]|nr:DUF1343 domain-containing protein [Deltaproteobacteria bacterium]
MVLFGLDVLLKEHLNVIKNKKVGIVAHPASINSQYIHIYDLLKKNGATITALFGPEHGFNGVAQDMESVHNDITKIDKIPLYSLYGSSFETLSPSEETVSQLDLLIIDLADVGSRYYTFIWTAVLCLDVCIKTDTPLMILDRPNPLNGISVEGAPQKEGFLSFVGLKQIAVRHGLTLGEIVLMNAKEKNALKLVTVIKTEGWKREMFYDDTHLPWVPPSPNMPALDTAIIYPGLCLLEGTEFSEGRGTTTPFEMFGAPGVDSVTLCKTLNSQNLLGVVFRPVSFKPMFQKHKEEICTGAAIHITDRNSLLPYKTGMAIIWALYTTSNNIFKWRHKPYEFVKEIPAIDLLTGSDFFRKSIEDGAHFNDIYSINEKETTLEINRLREYRIYS